MLAALAVSLLILAHHFSFVNNFFAVFYKFYLDALHGIFDLPCFHIIANAAAIVKLFYQILSFFELSLQLASKRATHPKI